ncbi:alpha/beta hydrolase [Spirosoma spitsbergense]|uniref:alpha/beta hydrolase n=1 Tax=Spirosoma spitsbergense TaxID=431554 RepID=UPI0003645188|nr:dienelactone hydrolase family protein [Spirosoma spitsbergense]
MNQKAILTAGQPLENAPRTLILLHGRGGRASDILSIASHLTVSNFAILAPQAPDNSWYPASFLAPPAQNEPWLSSSLSMLADLVESLERQGIPPERLYFLGFSQGACLTLEFVTRQATRYGGVVAFTGGLIGDKIYLEKYSGTFLETPIFIGTGDPDFHVPVERVHESTALLKSMGADITEKVYVNMGHTISQNEINEANSLIFRQL